MIVNKKTLVGIACIATLAGCSSFSDLLESDRIDYKSEGTTKSSARRLEIPPDLTQLRKDNRYSIPEAGTITASDYNQKRQDIKAAHTTAIGGAVAPKGSTDIHIEKHGSQRWLVVNRSPEVLWPQIRDFWQDHGFLINIDSPETGVMETDWAENRAKLPADFIRNSIGKLFDALYSTGERDKFRTRLERNSNGMTEIYISHRGAQEEIVGANKDSTMWTARPSDPELEAEFLSRLMVQLSDADQKEKAKAKAIAAKKTIVLPSKATIVKGDVDKVVVDESFDRTWRRVGLALDRVGFTVEDRDRSKGIYFVRYVDQDKDANNTPEKEKGFLGNLFTFSGSKEKYAKKYQISVKESGGKSQVVVFDDKGKIEKSSTGRKIISLLYEQLR